MDHDRALPTLRRAGPRTNRRAVLAATLLMLALGASGTASGEPIYRCGNSFSQLPCPQAQVIEPRNDSPRAEDVRATRQVAERDAALAAELARERERREKLAARQGAASLSRAARQGDAQDGTAARAGKKPSSKSSSSRAHRRATHPSDDFTAVVPGSSRKRGGS